MHSTAVLTRAEIEAKYGAIPPLATTWAIHRSHASVTYVTGDGGAHWTRKRLLHAAERARRELDALERQETC